MRLLAGRNELSVVFLRGEEELCGWLLGTHCKRKALEEESLDPEEGDEVADFHTSMAPGRCTKHVACLESEEPEALRELASAIERRDYVATALLVDSHSSTIVVSRERSLLQVFDCKRSVAAQMRVDVGALELAMHSIGRVGAR